ncbi:hypothetical protein MSG28_008454 [Choristoneura fumiferana]|uniref:Uncharacterized protein n=1 Tax=Choristoneura fumiferana TaxID=7141 RepID=A0ACC0J4Q7_CHOFU|nr:hypothetical protein MSG28_008454 [Choristoneura fumiferana]
MTISNHPVLILTCKHLKERRRRLFHTIWEITSGVLVFVMLLLMRQVIKHSHFTQDRGDVSGTRLNEIIYTPNNKLMQTFMTKVANNFGQRHARTNSALVPFKGFPNEAAVDDYMASLSSVNGSNPIAVDVNTTLPNLDYTIKLVDKADLKLYRPKLKQIPIYEPLNTKEQASFPLMKLQWAIDRTFMERQVFIMTLAWYLDMVNPGSYGVAQKWNFLFKLRGPKCEARASAENLIKKLHLEDKADLFSGVRARRWSRRVGTRRTNVLRGDKTVLMTTTSIEEADALGDRIALLSHGKLKLTLKHKRNMSTVRQVIGESLPEAVTTKIDHKRILFTLPAKDHELFPKLFDTLEERREELGISAMDVERLKGWALHLQQLKVLIRRNFFHIIYFPVDSLNDASMAINMFSNFYMFSQMPGQYSPIRTRTVNPQQVKLFIPKENILVRSVEKADKPSGRILLVDDLHKNFVNLCQTTPINAVHGVSFSVKGGESIGLLGPPGSGKTSALSMIAGRQSITRGDCCLDGWFLRMQRSQYIAKVSLVKCTGGLDEFYTGYENLKILCLLRGYSLQHLTHTSVRRYSAGCARLLRLCAALLAAPPAVLLDEPMRSVDPHSRPLVARALARLTGRGSAVVLAEQSLNWRDIDTLCSRIAVFTNGQISALGSSRHVRAMLANGHTARLKLKLKPIRTSISEDSTSDIFSNDDEAADDAEAIKKLKEKRRLEIAAAMKHFNDPDDIEFDNNDKKSDSGKSTQHDDRRESSSQQAARDERRLYLTSRQGSEITETEDEDIEDIKKVYQKSQHNFVKIQLDDDDDDEDNSQPDNANPDKAQTTAEELEISRTGNVPKEGESDQAKTSQPVSAQLSNVESKIDQPVTSRAVAKSIYSNKDQSRGLEGQQSMDELKILLIRDETELAEPLLIRDDSNVRFLRDNNLKGTVYDDITRETMKRNVISLRSVQALKTDFKNEFPTSKLADEHLSMLHFHIKGDKNMTYSSMFSKLEKLKRKYENIIEDYTLSEISIDDVHSAEIYCEFSGPCTALDRLFTTIKLDWSDGTLILLKVLADAIEEFERFRNHSEPVYVFIHEWHAMVRADLDREIS